MSCKNVKQNIFPQDYSTVQQNTSTPQPDLLRVSTYTVALGMLSKFGNLPREDSEAEEDLLTLNARSESLSSGLLL